MDSQISACVRQGCLSDLATVRDLIHSTIDFSYAAVYPPRAVLFFKKFHSEKNILQRYRDGGVVVAEREGRILGTGSLAGAEILGVFVLPEFQGQGLGGMIMNALEQKALASGAGEVELSISLPSRAFYENLGYEVVADRSFDVGEGQTLNYWQARKALKKLNSSPS
jgi:GNAT superfamily N-acetyltransferase